MPTAFFVGPTPTIHKIKKLLAVGYPMDLKSNKDNKASKFKDIEKIKFGCLMYIFHILFKD